MKIEEVIKQLESIADHTERMLGDPDADEIWEKDIEALKFAITALCSMPEAGEPLSLEQLREVPHGKIKDSTLQNIANRVNEIASPPAHIDRSKWEACKKCRSCWTCKSAIEPVRAENSKCFLCEDLSNYEPLNFCPHCGRPLTEEAWAELERRLRLSKPPEED